MIYFRCKYLVYNTMFVIDTICVSYCRGYYTLKLLDFYSLLYVYVFSK